MILSWFVYQHIRHTAAQHGCVGIHMWVQRAKEEKEGWETAACRVVGFFFYCKMKVGLASQQWTRLKCFLNIRRPVVGTALVVLYVNGLLVMEDVGVNCWGCDRLVWTEIATMSYVRVPQVPTFLRCCHGNCFSSLLLDGLCEEERPIWQCTVVGTRREHKRAVEKTYLSHEFIYFSQLYVWQLYWEQE